MSNTAQVSDHQIIKKKKKIITAPVASSSNDDFDSKSKSKFANVKSPSDSKSSSESNDNGKPVYKNKEKKPWDKCSQEELQEILASIEEQQAQCKKSIVHFINLMNSAKSELPSDNLTFDQHIADMLQKFDKTEKKSFADQSHSQLCHSIGCINDKLFEHGKKYNELEYIKSKVTVHLK